MKNSYYDDDIIIMILWCGSADDDDITNWQLTMKFIESWGKDKAVIELKSNLIKKKLKKQC
jgi:hypothetical protein